MLKKHHFLWGRSNLMGSVLKSPQDSVVSEKEHSMDVTIQPLPNQTEDLDHFDQFISHFSMFRPDLIDLSLL